MWKRLFLAIGRFFMNHQDFFKVFIVLLIFFLLIFILYKMVNFENNYHSYYDYKRQKIEKRNEIIKYKLSGKKPMRKLKLLRKYLEWKKERLEDKLSLTETRLKNINAILDEYSW